jgi:hypothetical protein
MAGGRGVGHVNYLRPRLARRQLASDPRKQSTGIKNTTDKKMDDKKINEGTTEIPRSYIPAVHLPSSFSFRPFSFLAALVLEEGVAQHGKKRR